MATNDNPSWVDSGIFRDRWSILNNLEGGGQGKAFHAQRKDDGRVAFLKTIKAKTDRERRARFFREAMAYDTFKINGIPRLIESNAHFHNELAYEPYIATTFVTGPTLRKWRDTQHDVSLDAAVAATRRLLTILQNCHEAECVHRDVKPDNLILESGDPTQLWLLDFGLTYHHIPDLDFQTEDWREVGNRFLRLPELSAGSLLKQDPRSDLSFAAGILFYLITGEHPDVLQDAEGRLPHQRSRALAKLQSTAGPHFPRLAALFDSALAPVIADRPTKAATMLDSLDRMMRTHGPTRSMDEDLAAILEVIDTSAQRRQAETVNRLKSSLHEVQRVFSEAEQLFNHTLTMSQTGFRVSGQVGRNTLFWSRPGSDSRLLSTTYEVREAGDELVFQMSGETVYRTNLLAPEYGDQFRTSVQTWLFARIRAVVSDPDALPPEADIFGESRPFARLYDAAQEARRSERKILAFVFDPSQPERGRLQWALGYFLQNKRTRDTMNATFVTALVPLSQIIEHSTVLTNLSMETARWVVFDSSLTAIEHAVIHANPQEGESMMAELSTRFGNPKK
jgi:eukaryotic-like serine/threonine-protein kinase